MEDSKHIDEILAIIDEGLADVVDIAEAYKKNFVATNQLPEVTRPPDFDSPPDAA